MAGADAKEQPSTSSSSTCRCSLPAPTIDYVARMTAAQQDPSACPLLMLVRARAVVGQHAGATCSFTAAP